MYYKFLTIIGVPIKEFLTSKFLKLFKHGSLEPRRIEILGGKKYILVTMDDFSRFTMGCIPKLKVQYLHKL